MCSGNDAVRKCVPGGVSVRSACVRRGVAVRKCVRLVSCCCVVGVPPVSRRTRWFAVRPGYYVLDIMSEVFSAL